MQHTVAARKNDVDLWGWIVGEAGLFRLFAPADRLHLIEPFMAFLLGVDELSEDQILHLVTLHQYRDALEELVLVDCEGFQSEVGEWAETIFTKSTFESRTTHLAREVAELARTEPGPHRAEEMADCFIMLLQSAHKEGVSLIDEARKKMGKNILRAWGEPDADGVVEHVRGEHD